jgi:hypothetical protein
VRGGGRSEWKQIKKSGREREREREKTRRKQQALNYKKTKKVRSFKGKGLKVSYR